jgi:hypothetical protein
MRFENIILTLYEVHVLSLFCLLEKKKTWYTGRISVEVSTVYYTSDVHPEARRNCLRGPWEISNNLCSQIWMKDQIFLIDILRFAELNSVDSISILMCSLRVA